MPTKSPPESSNRILSRLSTVDLALVKPHLKRVDLPLRKQLEPRNKPIDYIYFMESGFASVVANGAGRTIEVGLIGREGMSGLAVVMGADRTTSDTFIQSAGTGSRIEADQLRRALEQSRTFQAACLLYAQAFMTQMTYTAISNGRSKIEERLARWILMASDRVGSDEMALTHEFLSMMLGVRRSGVTVALHLLVQAGLIKAQRGIITVLNRDALKEISNGAYGVPEAEFRRLFG
jgi:CRP-like cAMP-binding protein